MNSRIVNKTILIIGGTGSLGNQLIQKYLNTNEIHIFSRDECKHWKLSLKYKNNPSLHFHIGDIRDYYKVKLILMRVNPHIVISAAALKHIDICEYESNECVNTNILGTQNIINAIEELFYCNILTSLESFCFVSTDKACSPVNLYGMSKAVSECLVIEKAKKIKSIKFVTVRYGNVLNSRGSIIPTLHQIGQDPSKSFFTITSDRMTRFVMTLEQSVDLIEHALLHGKSGEIVIPKLISCKIIDLIEIFSEKYKKPIHSGTLRPGEKILESLINETQSTRLRVDEKEYFFIRPPFMVLSEERTDYIQDYNSKLNPISKADLKLLLENLNLLDPSDENFS